MGYYSHFTLYVQGATESDLYAIMHWIHSESQNDRYPNSSNENEFGYNFDREWWNDGNSDIFYTNDIMKWYDVEDDLRALSAAFPAIIFMMEVEGDDRDDNWRLYATNGVIQASKGHIVYAPVDIKWNECPFGHQPEQKQNHGREMPRLF